MKESGSSKEINIVGFIEAIKENEDGDPIAIKIETDDGKNYIVELNSIGKEMLNLIDEEVKVSGIVKKGADGALKITVSDYEPAEDIDDDDIYNDDKD